MFWPGQAGAAEASRWALLCVAVPTALCFIQVKPNKVYYLGLAFFLWSILTILWAPVRLDSVPVMMQIAVISGSFLLGHATTNISTVYRGLGIGLGISSIFCLFQFLGYQPVVTNGEGDWHPPGLFINPNILGEISAVVLVALVFSRAWFIALLVVPSLLLSQCRGALLGVAVCGCIYAVQRWKWRALLAVPVVLGLLVLYTHEKNWTLHSVRTDIWLDTIAGLTFWGNGLGSFGSIFPLHATRVDTTAVLPVHAHNDFLEILFELGAPGLVLFLGFIAAIAYKSEQRERYILVALGTTALFGFPLHTPTTAFVLGIVAGYGARGWDMVRDYKLHSGPGLYEGGKQFAVKLVGGCRTFIPI